VTSYRVRAEATAVVSAAVSGSGSRIRKISVVLAFALVASVALVALAARPAHASAPPPAEARGRAEKVLDKQFQTQLPDAAERARKVLDKDYQKDLPRKRHESQPVRERGGSVVAQGVVWVIAGVLLVLLVLFIVREFGGGKNIVAPAIVPGDDGSAAAANAAVVERPLDDAEALARAGRFGEAIHVLLLRTLEELVRRLDRPLPRSRTSREILAEVRLPEEAHGALAHLIGAVEVSFFGGDEPGERDYQVCVDRFRVFADAYTRGVRA
jgi:hypothetical protein